MILRRRNRRASRIEDQRRLPARTAVGSRNLDDCRPQRLRQDDVQDVAQRMIHQPLRMTGANQQLDARSARRCKQVEHVRLGVADDDRPPAGRQGLVGGPHAPQPARRLFLVGRPSVALNSAPALFVRPRP
jgi:hypothetical protein